VVARAYSLEQQNAGRADAGLCHASSYFLVLFHSFLFFVVPLNALGWLAVSFRVHSVHINIAYRVLIFTAQHYASAVYAVVMSRVSSVTCRRYCIRTVKCRITQTKPCNNPGTLVWCWWTSNGNKSWRLSAVRTLNRGKVMQTWR